MAILLKQVRIKNFRSLESIDIVLGMTNVLIGQNNCGKSNFLKAIDIALNGSKTISDQDIYIQAGERLSQDKSAIIDILIVPTEDDKHFSGFWTGVFTDKWISTNETYGQFVGIRTEISFDLRKNDYSITRNQIKEWNGSLDESLVGRKQQYGIDFVEFISSFFMDAHRDVTDDIRNSKSYFGRSTSLADLSDELIQSLEQQLTDVNGEIVRNIPSLQQTAGRISAIGKTLGNSESSVQIEPLTRKIGDLHKGMDVTFKDGNGASFSVSQHGLGTRSWISFLTLGAYVDWFANKIKVDDEEAESFVILTMEEPEAHLHPQAQRQLYSQISGFSGQKIISTHSPNVLAQANLFDIIHLYKTDGRTSAKRFIAEDYSSEEMNRIQREVISTRGELLFSTAIVLCEGITEEQALPIFFNEYFGEEPSFCGINIIGVGGQNYKAFLQLIKDFNIKWFIFSDGEIQAIKSVKKAVAVISQTDIGELDNVIVLDNGEDYESHLISSGYANMMIDAINKCEVLDMIDEAVSDDHGVAKETFFQKFIRTNNHTSCGRHVTDKPRCTTCNQEIFEDQIRDYDGSIGFDKALYDCCTSRKAKAKYACYVAEEIISQNVGINKIPPKIKDLFKAISSTLNIEERSEYREA